MTVCFLTGDCREVLRTLPDQSVHCCVTSPPYLGLRDYGVYGQIGLEATPDEYVAEMMSVFREVWRVLRSDGTLWLNLGDSYSTKQNGPSVGATTLQGGTASHAQYRLAHARRSTGVASGLKHKDLIGIPWMVAFALRADGWYLRKDIIWHKPNCMPESVTDRPTSAHEYLFLLSKSERYWYDAEAIKEAESVPGWDDGTRVYGGVNKAGANLQHGERTTGRRAGPRKRGVPPKHAQYASSDQSGLDTVGRGYGRNARSVWTIPTRPFAEAHFATMAPDLAERAIKAGCPVGGTVLDPFGGAGTTGLVADRLQRDAILIELNQSYIDIARRRVEQEAGMFSSVEVL